MRSFENDILSNTALDFEGTARQENKAPLVDLASSETRAILRLLDPRKSETHDPPYLEFTAADGANDKSSSVKDVVALLSDKQFKIRETASKDLSAMLAANPLQSLRELNQILNRQQVPPEARIRVRAVLEPLLEKPNVMEALSRLASGDSRDRDPNSAIADLKTMVEFQQITPDSAAEQKLVLNELKTSVKSAGFPHYDTLVKAFDTRIENLKNHNEIQRRISDVSTIDLSNTATTDADLTLIKGFPNLRELFLDQTKITNEGLRQIADFNLPIRVANFSSNGIDDEGLRHVAKMKELKYLNLDDNKMISDEGLKRLSHLSGLNGLAVNNTSVGDAGLTELKLLKNLQWFSAVNTQITNRGLPALAAHPNLEQAYLFKTQVTKEGINATTMRPTLRVLLFDPDERGR